MPRSARRALVAAYAAAVLMATTACAASGGEDDQQGTSGDGSGAAAPGYPVSIENCGRTLTFDAPPERVVTLWQAPTEMMLALGLGDRITAVAGSYAPYPDGLAEEAKRLDVIGTSMGWPSRETLLSAEPDLVIGQSIEGFAFDTSAGYASVEQLEESGAQVYGANLCTPDDAATWNLDSSSDSVRDLGKIFGVSERADEIIEGLASQRKAVVDAVAGREEVDVAYFNGGDGP